MGMTMVHGIMRDLDAERKSYEFRSKQVRLAAESLRLGEIDRVCGRYELESDEFYTREQKAAQYIAGRR